jgi:hypothetical protein
MARRRARAAQARVRALPDSLPVSARVAWTYLASLVAAVAAAGAVVVTNQSVAVLACRAAAEDLVGDCKFSWMIWSGLIGFLVTVVPVALRVKLDWWLIVALWAQVGLWLIADAVGEWWWWAAVAVIPGVAALISADWQRGQTVRRVQVGVLIALAVGAVGGVIWWFANA